MNEKRTFNERWVTFPNGARWAIFDVVQPGVWNKSKDKVYYWSLSRLIVSKSGIEVMRFSSPTGQKPWHKADNPYAVFLMPQKKLKK
jgi:hypothetical protein